MGVINGVTLAANSARGNADGQDLTHSNTHVEAGGTAHITSGKDTTLQGAVVAGHTVQAEVGGNLAIDSLQDVSTYTSRQQSVGGSITIGPSPGGSISASKGNIDSTYASVVEQSGIQAGDGGYQVTVNGNTDLKGGVIASSDAAIAQGANRFDGAGTLTQSDIVNSAAYTARSSGISVGTGGAAVKGVGIGMGSDSGNQSTVTRSGIGVASSTDTAAAIRPIFDAARVQAEVGAQAAITQAFTLEAPKAVANYAGSKAEELKTQARQAADAGDDGRAHELNEEAAKWEEDGRYRIALHAVAGALGGGVSGAAGAAASAGSAGLMNELQDSTQAALQEAGLSADTARMVAQGVASLTAAGVGAAVGGGQGAATAVTVDANNRQLHMANFERLREGCRNSSSTECQTINRMAGTRSGTPTEDPNIPASKVVANYDANGNVVSYVLIDRNTNRPTMILEPLDYAAYRNAPPGMQALMQLSPQYALDFASAGLHVAEDDNGRTAEHVISGVASRDYARDFLLGLMGAGMSAATVARPAVAEVITAEGTANVAAAQGNGGAVTAAAQEAAVAQIAKNAQTVPPNYTTITPLGQGASSGPVPSGYVTVSRWVSPEEAVQWMQNQGTAIPAGVGTPVPGTSTTTVYVTAPGAAKPGGTGPIRIDFAVPEKLLNTAGNSQWSQIYQPSQSTPVYNVRIDVPNGIKIPGRTQ